MVSNRLNSVVAVIGDVVGSRQHADRARLHSLVLDGLDIVNQHVAARQPLAGTIGDEFQGLYDSVFAALDATLLLRTYLSDEVDVRFGIGLGAVTLEVSDRAPFAQDGPAWWAARSAIQDAERRPLTKRGPRHARTYYKNGSDRLEPEDPLVNAYLFCRDHIVGEMDVRDHRLLFGLLTGRRQSDLADELDVSSSAVSQRNARSGAYALLAAEQELRAVLP